MLVAPDTGNLLKSQSDFLPEVAFEVSVALGVEQEKKTLCVHRFSWLSKSILSPYLLQTVL